MSKKHSSRFFRTYVVSIPASLPAPSRQADPAAGESAHPGPGPGDVPLPDAIQALAALTLPIDADPPTGPILPEVEAR